ncbi:GroES-like protein [Epithele typhae]|uniref:GroES-like protein n=1 Tax=Epithele typhae TaxID=378194 RepID=UPI002008005E|nr:GroES-like protein [Epithele typhae]KAH9921196.1 GroES-like protein [Epithele typhae]
MSARTTHKALVLAAAGASSYSMTEVPTYTPGPDEVVVKIEAVGLNPIDWKLAYQYSGMIPFYPYISGHDGAGTVVAVGSEVATLAKGDSVIVQGDYMNKRATFQQFNVVSAALTAKMPSNISFDEAATIPLGLLTVLTAMYHNNPNAKGRSLMLPPPWVPEGATMFAGKPIFILGGASSVGQYAIQVAKLAGFSPIITTASPRNRELLRSLGATHVLDRALPDAAVLAELPRLTSGRPIPLVYDAISLPETQTLAYRALADGGGLVVVLPSEIPDGLRKAGDGKTVAASYGSPYLAEHRAFGEEVYAWLGEWLETGVIKPNKVEVLAGGLAGVAVGLARMRENKVSAVKLVVHPQETP